MSHSLPWKGEFCVYICILIPKQTTIFHCLTVSVIKGRKKSNSTTLFSLKIGMGMLNRKRFSQIDRRGQKSTALFNRALSRL